MSDNFILKKAEAWEASSAMKFIRGAARMSVRHWQSKDPITPPKVRLNTHKSTSCEQLYPYSMEDEPGPFGMRRAPSQDRLKPEHKPLFKLLGNSKKKVTASDASESKARRSVLNFRKSEMTNSKNVHEKYVPLPQTAMEPIYSEPRPWSSQFDDCCKPPVYQSVDKFKKEGSITDKKMYSNRPPCYDELAQKLSRDRAKKAISPARDAGVMANKITQNNNKVVIYFGDSIIRKHNEQKKEINVRECTPPKEEAIYVNTNIDNNIDRVIDKGGGTQMVSEVEVQEAIYSELKSEDRKESTEVVAINDATYRKDLFGTISSDGFLIVEFEGNFERAQQLVDIVTTAGTGADHHEATVLDEDINCDWSFIQNWRKRYVSCLYFIQQQIQVRNVLKALGVAPFFTLGRGKASTKKTVVQIIMDNVIDVTIELNP